jgi:DNA-binding transcriptional MerR regulator
MDIQRFVAGPLSVLCILALVMGTASAATGSTSNPDTRPVRHHLSPEIIISQLEQQGVDVTEVRTLLGSGNTEAVKEWLEAHRPAMPEGAPRSPPDLTDPPQQEKIIARLEEQGVDVTEVRNLLGSGNTEAVKEWLEAYLRAHRPARTPLPDLSDPVQEQRIIDRLEEHGVDVTEVETELQGGDTEAVKTWLENYFHTHEGEMPCHHPGGYQPPGQTGTSD